MASESNQPPEKKIPETPYIVKIENLSKGTWKASLQGKLVQYNDHIVSIHVVNCPASPANFAYVNCRDSGTAGSIVKYINKNVLLDSNLLTAKLKGKRVGSEAQGCSVKVLIHDHLTKEDLDQYFSTFGKLSRPSVIRFGQPNYAYINFSEPCSAQQVRDSKGPHHIKGMVVTIRDRAHPKVQGSPAQDVSPASHVPSVGHFPVMEHMGHLSPTMGHPFPAESPSPTVVGHPSPSTAGHPSPPTRGHQTVRYPSPPTVGHQSPPTGGHPSLPTVRQPFPLTRGHQTVGHPSGDTRQSDTPLLPLLDTPLLPLGDTRL